MRATSSKGAQIVEFAVSNPEQRAYYLQEILHDDIKTGYLMGFCEAQHCAENLMFISASSKFKDLFIGDGFEWKSWKSKEPRVVNNICTDKLREIERDMNNIAEHHLYNGSHKEICIPEPMLEATLQRMKEVKSYGPEVFEEACMDPFNTVIRDILPRFSVSSHYKEMMARINDLEILPTAKQLSFTHVKMLKNENPLDESSTPAQIEAYYSHLGSYYTNPRLYNCFLKYLKRIVSSENLLCLHSIDLYNSLYRSKYDDDINNVGNKEDIIYHAWFTYKFFLAHHACYEVGVSHAAQSYVAMHMYKPRKNMFDVVRKELVATLETHFINFKKAKEFRDVIALYE